MGKIKEIVDDSCDFINTHKTNFITVIIAAVTTLVAFDKLVEDIKIERQSKRELVQVD